jgi:hypothetical protein
MKTIRLVSLALVAILAIGLAVASAASAAEPLFDPIGSAVTATSGISVLSAGGETVSCARDSLSGAVTSTTLIGDIAVHFLECTAKNSGGTTCPAMSVGAPLENLILTKTLHAVLGTILPKPERGMEVALVLLPIAAGNFVTILGSCIAQTTIEGQVAGLVKPVGVSTTKGTVTFGVTGGKQNITDVDLSTGGLIQPKLRAFGLATATEETIETVTYATATEVT